MSKFPLDLSKFKKISSDSNVSLLKHEDGHEIKIAHQGLSTSLKKKLADLPIHAAEGAEISKEDQFLSKYLNQPQASQMNEQPKAADVVVPSQTAEQMAQPVEAQRAPEALTPQPKPNALTPEAQKPIPPAASLASVQSGVQQLGGLEAEKLGAMAAAQALGTQGAMEASAAKKYQNAYEKKITDFAKEKDLLELEAQTLRKELNEKKVDPQQFIKNMTTGDRILTGISLFLGGFGSALAGGPDHAYEFFNKQIDNDIKEQQRQIDVKHSLLRNNLERQQNLRQSFDMTRMQMSDILAAQLRAAAGNAQNTQAAANMLQIAGKFEQQSAQLQNQLAMQRVALREEGEAQQQGLSSIDPAKLVPYKVPKEMQDKAFKEIQAAENTRHMAEEIMTAFDQAAKENTVLRTGAGLVRTPASVYRLHQAMQPTFQDLEGTVRQAAMDNTFKNVTPSPGDLESTVAEKKTALMQYLKSKMSAPIARSYGIDLSQFQRTAQPIASHPMENKTGTLPDGTRIKIVNGRPVKI